MRGLLKLLGHFELLPIDPFLLILSKLRGRDIVHVARLNRALRDKVYQAIPVTTPEEAKPTTITYLQLITQFNNTKYKKVRNQANEAEKISNNYRYAVSSHYTPWYQISHRWNNNTNYYWNSYDHNTLIYALGVMSAILLSLGIGAYTGIIFNRLFQSKFIAIENGILAGAMTLLGGERLSLYSAHLVAKYDRYQENKYNEKSRQLAFSLHHMKKPDELVTLQQIHHFK